LPSVSSINRIVRSNRRVVYNADGTTMEVESDYDSRDGTDDENENENFVTPTVRIKCEPNSVPSPSSSSVSSSSPRSGNIRHRGDCRCDVCIKKYKFAPSLATHQNPTKIAMLSTPIYDHNEVADNLGDSNSIAIVSTLNTSEDDSLKQSPPPAHCHSTLNRSSTDDIKPLDLTLSSIHQTSKISGQLPSVEQPLNLCSKRKRRPPVNSSPMKHNAASISASTTSAASTMFMPFYPMPPFFDPASMNQQQILQQLQSFYFQIQQQKLASENTESKGSTATTATSE
jgi:hypothetical protein